MIKLNYDVYKDKVNACWIGKNIGGTMGTPYEGTHDYLDVKGFVTKKGEVLPNDDLDLQLIWLLALERVGAQNITASLLGEYWLSFIVPYWNEYGIGKANMKRGLLPPLAGDYENSWRDSNGAWIRTEIWACVTPANPGAAAKYAIEDAKVDHGVGEGTYAAAFVAAMQSSAFVISDIYKCIELGLSAIPEESRVAKSVKFVLDAYKNGMSAREARDAVQQMNADIGNGWFEAPSNVAYTVLGLVWGEGDFKKSMITAINCGDDTDCTAATVGATLGILYGTAGIPADWREYLGDDIVTISLNRASSARGLPKTCAALTERVVRVAPAALFDNFDVGYDKNVTDVSITEKEAVIPEDVFELEKAMITVAKNRYNQKLKANSLHFSGVQYDAVISLPEGPKAAPLAEIPIEIEIFNKNHFHDDAAYAVSLRWLLPEGFSVSQDKSSILLYNWTRHTIWPSTKVNAVIKAGESVEAVNRAVLEISVAGGANVLYCPVTLIG